jgi:hypothetical protein
MSHNYWNHSGTRVARPHTSEDDSSELDPMTLSQW